MPVRRVSHPFMINQTAPRILQKYNKNYALMCGKRTFLLKLVSLETSLKYKVEKEMIKKTYTLSEFKSTICPT